MGRRQMKGANRRTTKPRAKSVEGPVLEQERPGHPAEAVEHLRAVLRACPATAMLYENMHYDRSGLSQSPLDAAVASEVAASELIAGLRARAH